MKLFPKSITMLLFMFALNTIAFSQKSASEPIFPSCLTDSHLQKMRSQELSELVSADQKERLKFNNLSNFNKITKNEANQMISNDLARRKRVGEIMGEGCIKTAQDYAAAALIYQHGDVPDHYYQAFMWANRAVSLGDSKQKNLIAMTIDRYLVSIGKKQLFGSQFQASDKTNWCFCLQPVEPSFPDVYREKYLQKKLNEQYKLLMDLNKGKQDCKNIECSIQLSSTPRGSIVGFW